MTELFSFKTLGEDRFGDLLTFFKHFDFVYFKIKIEKNQKNKIVAEWHFILERQISEGWGPY